VASAVAIIILIILLGPIILFQRSQSANWRPDHERPALVLVPSMLASASSFCTCRSCQ